MKFCTECGHKNTDDSKFCENCGKELFVNGSAPGGYRKMTPGGGPNRQMPPNRQNMPNDYDGFNDGGTNKTRIVTIALVSLIAVLFAGVILVGAAILKENKQETVPVADTPKKETDQDTPADRGGGAGPDAGNVPKDETSQEEEAIAAFKEYFAEEVSAYGAVDESRLEAVLTSDTYYTEAQNWCLREGVVGMDLADLDSDGNKEMVIYRIVTETDVYNNSSWKLVNLITDIYRFNAAKEVEKVDSIRLPDGLSGSNASLEQFGIISLEGKEYLFQFEFRGGVFANGETGYWVLYTLDGGTFRKAYELGELGLGSAEMEFLVNTYTDEENYKTVYCAQDTSVQRYNNGGETFAEDYLIYDYENRYECDTVCWKQIGVELSAPRNQLTEGAEYWKTDLVRGGYSLITASEENTYDYVQTSRMYSEIENRSEYKAGEQNIPPSGREERERAFSRNTYEDILDQYRAVMSVFDADQMYYLHKEYPMVNLNLIQEWATNPTQLCYCLYDINNDGTKELLIGDEYTRELGNFYSLYTQKEGRLIPLITDCFYRTVCWACEDGSVIRYSSGGAFYGEYAVHALNEAGNRLIKTDLYEADFENYPDEPYYNGEGRLTEDEFNAEFRKVNPAEYEWQDF
ncbi:MAG: zinc-ribbon domain-containing protein [Lachnospiraceae bacterium]|nr:zinc-ribbon domain-containing protein [Lachnospiraceae bacterium]